jgi:DNA-binding response OmpR family regulator
MSDAMPLRILVADDEHDAVLALTMLLRDAGHEVRGVYRGDSVVEAVAEFLPDVVLLDLGMPHLTGYQVARELRSRYAGARPHLVAVTGRRDDKSLAFLAGIDHHLTKPCDPAQLLGLLRSLSAAAPAGRATEK